MKTIHISGKRKRAVARATLRPGKGVVKINNKLIEHYSPYKNKHKARLARLRGKPKKPRMRVVYRPDKTMEDWKPLIDAGLKRANEKNGS